jgi:hypothetical protein
MIVKLSAVFFLVVCWIGLMGPASAAPGKEVPASLKLASECMLTVAKAEPGAEHARSGIATDVDEPYVFVEYEPSEKTRWIQPTRFTSLEPHDPSDGHYTFQALLPGLVGPTGFDLHVTRKLIEEWKTQCGVTAIMLFN